MYPNQNPNEHRRNSFNNNKVLVGGDDKSHTDKNHVNIQINTNKPNIRGTDGPHTAPVVTTPMSNPFDNMPTGLKYNMPVTTFQSIPNFQKPAFEDNNDYQKPPPNFQKTGFQERPGFQDKVENNSTDSPYEEDLRTRSLDVQRNPSPPDYPEFPKDGPTEWQRPRFVNHRFPRNWDPRTNFRPNFNPQFWPRNGPRPPNRWMGPRPQRFW